MVAGLCVLRIFREVYRITVMPWSAIFLSCSAKAFASLRRSSFLAEIQAALVFSSQASFQGKIVDNGVSLQGLWLIAVSYPSFPKTQSSEGFDDPISPYLDMRAWWIASSLSHSSRVTMVWFMGINPTSCNRFTLLQCRTKLRRFHWAWRIRWRASHCFSLRHRPKAGFEFSGSLCPLIRGMFLTV